MCQQRLAPCQSTHITRALVLYSTTVTTNRLDGAHSTVTNPKTSPRTAVKPMASSNNSNTGHPCMDRGRSRGVQGKMVACSTQQQNRAGPSVRTHNPRPCAPAAPTQRQGLPCTRQGRTLAKTGGTQAVRNSASHVCRVCKKSARRLLLWGKQQRPSQNTRARRRGVRVTWYACALVETAEGWGAAGTYAPKKQRQHHAATTAGESPVLPLGCCERDYRPS